MSYLLCSKVIVVNPKVETYCVRRSGHPGKCSIYYDSQEEVERQLIEEAKEHAAIEELVENK